MENGVMVDPDLESEATLLDEEHDGSSPLQARELSAEVLAFEGEGDVAATNGEASTKAPARSASADVLPTSGRGRPRIGRLLSGRWVRRIALSLAIIFLIAFTGVAYATYDYDRNHDGQMLRGVTIAGVHVGGMDRDEALEAVEAVASEDLDRTIDVDWRDRNWTITPRELGARSNAEELVDAGLVASEDANAFEMASVAVFGDDFDYSTDLAITYPRRGARRFVSEVASSLDREPVDASIDYSTGWVKINPSKEGRKVRAKKNRRSLMGTLRTGGDEVDLAVKTTAPDVTKDHFDEILLLRIGENRLYFYDDGKIAHSWTVATGQPEYPTPTGIYEITEKRYMPTWVNPDPTGWGASMPAMIPPGPGNPLGTRALNWSASGIRFHGTEATYSLGYNASHGCIRMSMSDVEFLYDMVEVGTPIVSVVAGSFDPLYDSAPDPTVVAEDAGDTKPATEAEE